MITTPIMSKPEEKRDIKSDLMEWIRYKFMILIDKHCKYTTKECY